jgi:hypothetical protein
MTSRDLSRFASWMRAAEASRARQARPVVHQPDQIQGRERTDKAPLHALQKEGNIKTVLESTPALAVWFACAVGMVLFFVGVAAVLSVLIEADFVALEALSLLFLIGLSWATLADKTTR